MRSSRADRKERSVVIDVAYLDRSEVGPLDLIGGVPVLRPMHVDGRPALVTSQTLGSSGLGTVHIVGIAAGDAGLPWEPLDVANGVIGRRWPIVTAGGSDSPYFIGVFEP